MKSAKIILFGVAVALLSGSQADARIRFYNSGFWNTPRWTSHSTWLLSPSSRNENEKKGDPLDLDMYFDKGVVVKTSMQKPQNDLPGNSGVEDMKKKQSEVQKEMEKQRKEMEEKFSKAMSSEKPAAQPVEPKKQELPRFEASPTQMLPAMPETPKLQTQELPEIGQLPKMEAPTMANTQPSTQAKDEGMQTHQTPSDKAPATLDLGDETKSSSQAVSERKTESATPWYKNNYIVAGAALIFFAVGAMVFISR